MSIDSAETQKQKLSRVLGSSAELFTDEDFNMACETAMLELGWEFPVSGFRESYWVMERSKRHALDLLRTISAHKFKYKQISLNHRFEHYHALIKYLDEVFMDALNTDPALSGIVPEDMFGDYIGNRIYHDQFGNDISKLVNPPKNE